jgi:hypothetical protein
MPLFTQGELTTRQSILQTHKVFGDYLDINIIRILINLFDNKHDNYNPIKIDKYIEAKRHSKGYDNSYITITHEVYGINKGDLINDNLLYIWVFSKMV